MEVGGAAGGDEELDHGVLLEEGRLSPPGQVQCGLHPDLGVMELYHYLLLPPECYPRMKDSL